MLVECCDHLRMVLFQFSVECQCEDSILDKVLLLWGLDAKFFPFFMDLVSAVPDEVLLDVPLGLVFVLVLA